MLSKVMCGGPFADVLAGVLRSIVGKTLKKAAWLAKSFLQVQAQICLQPPCMVLDCQFDYGNLIHASAEKSWACCFGHGEFTNFNDGGKRPCLIWHTILSLCFRTTKYTYYLYIKSIYACIT